MYIAVLHTYDEIYAIGTTEDEAKKNVVKGYKHAYPRKDDRSVDHVTYEELNEYFGIAIYKIDKRGYAIEGGLY